LARDEAEIAFAITSQIALLRSSGRFQIGSVDNLLNGERLTELYGVGLTVETTSSGRRAISPSWANA
jgi:hypothetical protein